MGRWLRATINSWNGLCHIARTELAFRQELAALTAAVPLALFIAVDAWKRLTLIAVILLVLIVELVNTAVEKLADRVSRENDVEVGLVKDMCSAAVAVALLLAGLVWLLALAELVRLI